MADANYVTAVGFIQFDPQTRDANGKKVTDFTLKTPGGEKKYIRVTVWPELQIGPFEKGDFVAVDGKFSSSTYQGQDGSDKTSLQISASNIVILGKSAARSEREVENAAQADTGPSKIPF